jgi:hypothetical protein
LRLFPKALGFVGKTSFWGVRLFEMAALLLHCAAPFSIPLEEGGSAMGVLITDDCHGPGGDGFSVYLSRPGERPQVKTTRN